MRSMRRSRALAGRARRLGVPRRGQGRAPVARNAQARGTRRPSPACLAGIEIAPECIWRAGRPHRWYCCIAPLALRGGVRRHAACRRGRLGAAAQSLRAHIARSRDLGARGITGQRLHGSYVGRRRNHAERTEPPARTLSRMHIRALEPPRPRRSRTHRRKLNRQSAAGADVGSMPATWPRRQTYHRGSSTTTPAPVLLTSPAGLVCAA